MTNTSDLPEIRQRRGDRPRRSHIPRSYRSTSRLPSAPVVLTRALQASSEGRRLAVLGYGPDDVVNGLRIAFVLIDLSPHVRFTLGTAAEVVQTGSREPMRRSLGTLVMAASGLSLLGVSFLLLARSPFRMPPGERLFRVVWLGPPGRWFVSVSSRNVSPASSGKTAPGLARVRANVNIASTGRAAAPVVAATTTPTDRMRSLEDRVAALERWRRPGKHIA